MVTYPVLIDLVARLLAIALPIGGPAAGAMPVVLVVSPVLCEVTE
jgi:hypothetical protein